LTRLVSAWPIWRRSQTISGDGSGASRAKQSQDGRLHAGRQPAARYRRSPPPGRPAWECARRRRIRRPIRRRSPT
jgi:hypothetical protein